MQAGDTVKQSGTHRGRKPTTPGGPPVERDARWRITESFETGKHSFEIRGPNGEMSVGAGDGTEASAKALCDKLLENHYGVSV